jgi:hypothetical protein
MSEVKPNVTAKAKKCIICGKLTVSAIDILSADNNG